MLTRLSGLQRKDVRLSDNTPSLTKLLLLILTLTAFKLWHRLNHDGCH